MPEQYQVVAFNPFPDGSVRVDVNLYDAIVSLDGAVVTDPNGQPLDPQGGRFFVVVDNPDVDPTAPGYEPLYLGYAADGTPFPLIPGQ
ncbi:hypothetical protein [Salinispora arenicola]|uniref:hypothetical protein n=1 Tax=Salinispora arenicola TaxID=168697 RepID=UPI001E5AD327|nr:hypothetical protein [Salinispora arenicola]